MDALLDRFARGIPDMQDTAPQPVKRWKWNKAKAYDNMLEVAGMLAAAAFLAYMVVGWLMGTWQ